MRFDLLVPRPTLRPPFFGKKWAYNGFRPPFLSQNGHIRSKRPVKQSNWGIYSNWTPHYLAVFGHIKLICDVVWHTPKLLYGRKRPYRRKMNKSIEQTWKKLTLFAPSRPYRNCFQNQNEGFNVHKKFIKPQCKYSNNSHWTKTSTIHVSQMKFQYWEQALIYYSWQDTKASSAYLARMCTLRVS